MRFSDLELQIIKNTFAENEDLLKIVRKVFLQMDLNAVDLALLQTMILGKPDVIKVMKKTFMPELDPEVPIGQQIDLWLTIALKDIMPDMAVMHLQSIDLWRRYLEQEFRNLENNKLGAEREIKLSELSDIKDKLEKDIFVDMLARNTIVNSTEQGLMQLLILAGKKDETIEEMKKKLEKDSSK